MLVEVSEALRERLTVQKTRLVVAARFLGEDEMLGRYLDRPYGNAYDFDQVDGVEGF